MSTNYAVGRAVRCALSERSKKYAAPLNRALLVVAASAWAQVAFADQAQPKTAETAETAADKSAAVDQKP